MNKLLVIIFFFFSISFTLSQSTDPDVLLGRKHELENQIKNIDKSIYRLKSEKKDYSDIIERIDERLFEIGYYKSDNIFMYAKYIDAPLKRDPNFESDLITNIPQGDSAIFIEKEGSSYVKVKYRDKEGYVTNGLLVLKKDTVLPKNEKTESDVAESSLSIFMNDLRVNIDKEPSCESVSKRHNKFTDEVSFHTPEVSGIDFHKYTNNDLKYVVYIKVKGLTPIAWEKGAYVLFEDGTKFHFPNAEVESEVITRDDIYDYEYRSFIPITESQMTKLSNTNITDVRLYVFDKHVGEKDADIIKYYASCLINQTN